MSDSTQNTEEQNLQLIEGRNPVWEALKAERSIEKIYILKTIDQQGVNRILASARRQKIKIEWVPKERLDSLSPGGHHQGLIAVASSHEYAEFNATLDRILAGNETPYIIVLDEIMDPHNLGAIIRSAECVGAQMVVIPERRSAGLTEATIRSSAGAVEHVPVCKVGNIARTLEELEEHGIWPVGADMEGESAWNTDLTGPIALVIGNEGSGLRRLVKDKCSKVVSLPLHGKIDSLNASVAAGVLMYEVLRQRGGR